MAGMLTRREWLGFWLALLVGNLCFAVWAWGEPKTPLLKGSKALADSQHGEVQKLIPDRMLPTSVFFAPPLEIVDGDTVKFEHRGLCRLIGIDAPEDGDAAGGQPVGEQATKALRALLPLKDPVLVLVWGRDRYRRMLCLILAADGYPVNLTLVESGMAYVYLAEGFSLYSALVQAQQRAQIDRRGVWWLPKRELPWHYRARMRGR